MNERLRQKREDEKERNKENKKEKNKQCQEKKNEAPFLNRADSALQTFTNGNTQNTSGTGDLSQT